MKVFIRRLIILVFILFVVDLIWGFMMHSAISFLQDGRYYKAKYILDESYDDIIIIGSSTAETGFVSKIFEDSLGLSCFNASRGGQLYSYYESISKAVLKKYTPKYVIIDIHSVGLQIDPGYERLGEILKPFYNTHEEIRPILNNASPHACVTNRINFVAYNSTYWYLLRPFIKKGTDGKFEDKGWKPRNNVMAPLVDYDTLQNDNPLVTESVECFNRFVGSFIDKGVEVVFVRFPFYHTCGIDTKSIEYVNDYAKKHNIKFYDYFGLYDDNKLYNDQHHLNKNGAVIFTNEFVHTFKDECLK